MGRVKHGTFGSLRKGYVKKKKTPKKGKKGVRIKTGLHLEGGKGVTGG